MRLDTRPQLAFWVGLGAGLLLAACQGAAAPAVPLTRVTTPATPTEFVAPTSTAPPSATSTLVVHTPTALPSDTPTAAPTTIPSGTPTDTPLPGTATVMASVTTTVTDTAQPTHTRVPITASPAAASPTAAPPTLYSTTGGPTGYSSRIQCRRAGQPCVPIMPPGDLSFQLVLASDSGAPWTHFINYGLSVEKDGANVADMFMFVDAGWLPPGAVVGFGASRNFSQPGTYVVRSSGCMTTDVRSHNCAWATIAGDVVTLIILSTSSAAAPR